MSMLATTPEASAEELLRNIPDNITLKDFITNVLTVYPVELGAFKILKKENGVEVLNFPFNPPICPIAIMIQQALSSATMPKTETDQDKFMLGTQINNTLAQSMMNIIYMNRSVIEGETGLTLEDLLNKPCIDVHKQKNDSNLILADAQGNVQGDIIEIVLDF